MTEQKVPYEVNGRQFEGMIVYHDSVKTKRPVMFMQPDWKGICPDTIAMAHTAAGKDYIVLMADMYGTGYGTKPKTREQLAAGMKAVHTDLAFTVACGGKAYDTMLAEANKLGLVDTARKFAVGYCAGGGFVLEQARAGQDFKGVPIFDTVADAVKTHAEETVALVSHGLALAVVRTALAGLPWGDVWDAMPANAVVVEIEA